MTEYDGLDEAAEMERLKLILQEGNQLKQQLQSQQKSQEQTQKEDDVRERTQSKEYDNDQQNPYAGVLSAELLEESGGTDQSDLIILPSQKKKKPKAPQQQVELTPQEIRQAKLQQKNAQRKLKQLEQRAEQKRKRAELYTKLQETAIQSSQMELLESSADFSKRKSKQEKLRRLIKKERAGLALTDEEKQLLYVNKQLEESTETYKTVESVNGPKKKQKLNGEPQRVHAGAQAVQPVENEPNSVSGQATLKCDTGNSSSSNASACETTAQALNTNKAPTTAANDPLNTDSQPKPQLFAEMMLASISKVKLEVEKQTLLNQKHEVKGDLEALAITRPPTERYVAPEPTVVKTAASLKLRRKEIKTKNRVIEIAHPDDVKATRLDLPVCAMEFEVMDAIRNNDVTIVCGETGSGKSTQIPQFIYSAGLTLGGDCDQSNHSMIGITQPRRVAAVSTAKRVCYEMGQGNGQTIKSKGKTGNLVAYQTRYETAGIGSGCHIKFMTDGILLQEIQSDLLLRKYSAIVLDEGKTLEEGASFSA